jgi:fatty-acyl-CoA synthase
MNGLMMQKQLLISSLIVHADRHHGDTEIVSRRVEGDIHRYTFRDCHRPRAPDGQRADQPGCQALCRHRHTGMEWLSPLELYYGVSGMGAILHTINLACMKTRSLTSRITPKTSTSYST